MHVIGAILLKMSTEIFQHSLVTASQDIRSPCHPIRGYWLPSGKYLYFPSVAITLRGIFASVANPTDVSQEIFPRAANIP